MKKIKTLIFVLQFYFLYAVTKLLILFYRVVGYKKAKKDLLFLECFTEDGAGYTYRARHWMDMLQKDGLQVESRFLVRWAVDFFRETTGENLPRFLIRTMYIRIKQIHYSRNFKVVVVRRNLLNYNQYGHHFMEKLFSAAHPNRILDFDDDVGATVIHDESKSLFHRLLMTSKDHFYQSFKYYNGFIPGSAYLKELLITKLENIDENVIQIIPTCVNYTDLPNKNYVERQVLTFGWIGGSQNLNLLEKSIPAMNQIGKNVRIQLIIMSGVENYDLGAEFPVSFEMYSLEKEIEFLKRMDVGLMPLNDNLINRGKCGFKLLQYMGVGVPGIASAVTVNNEIIDDDVNGWLVKTDSDWESVLKKVVLKSKELNKYGEKARETVEQRYTFKSNFPLYKKFITQFANRH